MDIKIEYTGLRTGEKLYEEKLMAEEGLTKTDNKLIHIGQPIAFDNDEFLKDLSGLMEAAYLKCSDLVIPLNNRPQPSSERRNVMRRKANDQRKAREAANLLKQL